MIKLYVTILLSNLDPNRNTDLLSMSSFIEVCKMNDLFIKVAEKPTFHNYHSENNHRYTKYKMLTFSGVDHAPLFSLTGELVWRARFYYCVSVLRLWLFWHRLYSIGLIPWSMIHFHQIIPKLLNILIGKLGFEICCTAKIKLG